MFERRWYLLSGMLYEGGGIGEDEVLASTEIKH